MLNLNVAVGVEAELQDIEMIRLENLAGFIDR
jgi:hypothetical protein